MKVKVEYYPDWGWQSPIDCHLLDADVNVGTGGCLVECDLSIPDGVYAIKDGKMVKIDSFTWGYEGLADIENSIIVDGKMFAGESGKNILFAGPGAPDNPVVDFRSKS